MKKVCWVELNPAATAFSRSEGERWREIHVFAENLPTNFDEWMNEWKKAQRWHEGNNKSKKMWKFLCSLEMAMAKKYGYQAIFIYTFVIKQITFSAVNL